MAPVPLPFRVSQISGLPSPYKGHVFVAKAPKPAIIATGVEPSTEEKKSVKAVRKHKSVQIVRQPVAQGRFAVYPPVETEGIW
jgi:hypothetical protein